jgi:hypothetical protein
MIVEKEQLTQIIRKRLALDDEEFRVIDENPKYRRLFENAPKAAEFRLVAEVVDSKGCHSGHVKGQKLYFDSTGNLLTKQAPDRVCLFLMPNLTLIINAVFENLMNGRDPNEIMFNRTGCFDVGHACGGWGHVILEVRAEPRD